MCTKQLSPTSTASMRLWTQNWCYLTCYPTCEPYGLLTKVPTYRPSLEQVQGHSWSPESKRLPIPLHYKEAEAWQREQRKHKLPGISSSRKSLPLWPQVPTSPLQKVPFSPSPTALSTSRPNHWNWFIPCRAGSESCFTQVKLQQVWRELNTANQTESATLTL